MPTDSCGTTYAIAQSSVKIIINYSPHLHRANNTSSLPDSSADFFLLQENFTISIHVNDYGENVFYSSSAKRK
jgi:hypothetical protein